jgi:hypothetical protein
MRLHHHTPQPAPRGPEAADSVVDQLAGAKMREALAATAAPGPRVLIFDGDIADGMTSPDGLAAAYNAQHGSFYLPWAKLVARSQKLYAITSPSGPSSKM